MEGGAPGLSHNVCKVTCRGLLQGLRYLDHKWGFLAVTKQILGQSPDLAWPHSKQVFQDGLPNLRRGSPS